MILSNDPTRAESNDIYSTLEAGCSGLVLAAETAIGNNPVECVNFLKECLDVFYKRKNFIKIIHCFFNNHFKVIQ
jgi:pyruvate kinase